MTCNGHHSVGNSRNLVRKIGLRNERYTCRRPSRGMRGEYRLSLVLVSHSVIQVVLCFETLPGSRALARPFSIYKPWESALSDVMMAWETWWCDRGWVPRSHCTAVRYQSTRPVTDNTLRLTVFLKLKAKMTLMVIKQKKPVFPFYLWFCEPI